MEWKEIPLKGDFPTPRAGHTATLVDNNQMIIFGGGVENGYSNEIFFLNLGFLFKTKREHFGKNIKKIYKISFL